MKAVRLTNDDGRILTYPISYRLWFALVVGGILQKVGGWLMWPGWQVQRLGMTPAWRVVHLVETTPPLERETGMNEECPGCAFFDVCESLGDDIEARCIEVESSLDGCEEMERYWHSDSCPLPM